MDLLHGLLPIVYSQWVDECTGQHLAHRVGSKAIGSGDANHWAKDAHDHDAGWGKEDNAEIDSEALFAAPGQAIMYDSEHAEKAYVFDKVENERFKRNTISWFGASASVFAEMVVVTWNLRESLSRRSSSALVSHGITTNVFAQCKKRFQRPSIISTSIDSLKSFWVLPKRLRGNLCIV